MSVPGSNILVAAMRLLGKQTVLYFKDLGRATNDIGNDITQFAEGIPVDSGSVQPVERSRYLQLGLDLNKDYVTWWVPLNVFDVDRDISGDQLEFDGARYGLTSRRKWFVQDGWTKALCVKVGPANA